ERDQLLGHSRRRIVLVRNELDLVPDRLKGRRRGLADRSDLGGLRYDGTMREQHVDRGRTGDGQPVEPSGGELLERVVECGLVGGRAEVNQRRDDGDSALSAQRCCDAVAPGASSWDEDAPAGQRLLMLQFGCAGHKGCSRGTSSAAPCSSSRRATESPISRAA